MFKIWLKKNEGMTLVEVLASLVLVSLIIISFLAVFPIVSKQNKSSEEVMDATYIAQSEMEKIITIADEKKNYITAVTELKKDNYTFKELSDRSLFVKTSEDGSYVITIDLFKEKTTNNTSNIVIKVFEEGIDNILNTQDDIQKAQIETILWWGGE